MKPIANAMSNLQLALNQGALSTSRGRTIGLRSSIFVVAFAITVSLGGVSQGQFGRYFQTPGADTITFSDASPVAFNKNVVVGGNTLGSVAFDYDTYVDAANTPPESAGAGLAGGFYLGNNAAVIPGYTLDWVQTITTTITGANQFNLPNTGAGEFPDADPTDADAAAFRAAQTPPLPVLNPTFAPAYVFTSPTVNPPTAVPTIGFVDLPGRSFADGAQTWTAELGLVAISNAKNGNGVRTVDVIDSLLWGFSINVGPNGVSKFSPNSFGPPTASYLSTLNNFYSGVSPDVGGNDGVDTDLYDFVYDPNALVLVPEPGTFALLVLGGFGMFRFGLLRRNVRPA